jgi:hypothetical protein
LLSGRPQRPGAARQAGPPGPRLPSRRPAGPCGRTRSTSPPRRGRRDRPPPKPIIYGYPIRLIPARAETTKTADAPPTATPAHPRACGDHGGLPEGYIVLDGSSPRVRRPPSKEFSQSRRRRLIPARAETTYRSASSNTANTAHPRACGDHQHYSGGKGEKTGSVRMI